MTSKTTINELTLDLGAIADTIFYNGDIITMNDNMPGAEAVAIKDSKIIAVGSKSDVFKTEGDATKVIDLNGKAMLPGFVDSWSHIGPAAMLADFADLSWWGEQAPADFKAIFAKLQTNQRQQDVKDGEWIVGWGYARPTLKKTVTPTALIWMPRSRTTRSRSYTCRASWE